MVSQDKPLRGRAGKRLRGATVCTPEAEERKLAGFRCATR